jgi:cytokinin dehydrogenase
VAADYNKFLVQGTPMPFHQWETFPLLNFPGTGAGLDPRYANYAPGLPGLWVALQEYGVFYNPDSPPNDAVLLSQFDHVPGSEQISDMSYYDWVYRLDFVFDVVLRQVGAWYNPHPWFEVMLPIETAFTTINSLLAQTPPTDVPMYSVQSIIPLKKPQRPGKYQLLPESNGNYYVYFGLLRSTDIGTGATEDRFPEAVRLLDVNDRLRSQVITAGGSPVVSSTIPTNPQEWKVVMGWSKYNSFVNDKRQYDPSYTLANNWNILDAQVDECNSFDRL